MPQDPKTRPVAPSPPPSADSENDRPTVNPPFDVEAFARATVSSSGPPGLPDFDLDEPRGQQITMTNEAELEAARVASTRTDPPSALRRPSALAIADARAPSPPAAPGSEPARSVTPSSIEAAVLSAIGSSPGPEITERTIDDPVAEMRERFSLGDYTGALEMADLLLAEEPGNLEAAECGENCRTVLEGMYAARLGPLDRVPMVLVPRTQMRWLSIDHRAGFILSLVDGSSSVELILDVCGMPKLDALRILHELVQQKIVALR